MHCPTLSHALYMKQHESLHLAYFGMKQELSQWIKTLPTVPRLISNLGCIHTLITPSWIQQIVIFFHHCPTMSEIFSVLWPGLAWPHLSDMFILRLPSHLSKELIFRVAPFWAEVNPISQMLPVRLQGYVGFPGGCFLSAPTLFQAHSRNFGQRPLFSLQSESHVHTSM